MSLGIPLTDADKAKFNTLNKETVEYLMTRYNKVNRWVIADMIRRSAYHFPNKTAMIFGDKKMTYAEMEGEYRIDGERQVLKIADRITLALSTCSEPGQIV
jgi:non-ribosomal peptide synthetase component E (peptide arylation enzyme)